MKKIIVSIAVMGSILVNAQTTILSDNFDSYEFPGTVLGGAGTIWDSWSTAGANSPEDAALNNIIFNSPDLSAFITGDGPGGNSVNDLMLKFPDLVTYTSGTYEFKAKVYIEDGFGGYFNLGGSWPGYGVNHDIGARIFFHADGTGQIDIADAVSFDYNFNEWIDIRFTIDLDAGTKTVFLNENLISADDPWEAPDGFGVVNIVGIAFTTLGLAQSVLPEMYIDDIELINTTPLSTDENSIFDQQVSIYPSPNNGKFTVEVSNKKSSDYSVTITDISGRLIEASNTNNSTTKEFNLNVSSGIYLVNISSEEQTTTRKIIIE